MNVKDLKLVLENLNPDTEIFIENSYGLKYKVKDFRAETTSKTERLYLIMKDDSINIKDLYEKSDIKEGAE